MGTNIFFKNLSYKKKTNLLETKEISEGFSPIKK